MEVNKQTNSAATSCLRYAYCQCLADTSIEGIAILAVFQYSTPGLSILSVSIPAVRYCRYLLEMQSFLYLLTTNIPICPRNGSACSNNRQYRIDLAGIKALWYRVSKVLNLCALVSISFLLLVSAKHYLLLCSLKIERPVLVLKKVLFSRDLGTVSTLSSV